MPFKFNIGDKGKSWKIEAESEGLIGKKIGDKIKGEEIAGDLAGYELEITGTSDKAGFPGMKSLETPFLKRVLLTNGFGMHRKPRKEGKRQVGPVLPDGLRLKKTVRGSIISLDTIQINVSVKKSGSKKLEDVFPEQNKKKEEAKPAEEKKAE